MGGSCYVIGHRLVSIHDSLYVGLFYLWDLQQKLVFKNFLSLSIQREQGIHLDISQSQVSPGSVSSQEELGVGRAASGECTLRGGAYCWRKSILTLQMRDLIIV